MRKSISTSFPVFLFLLGLQSAVAGQEIEIIREYYAKIDCSAPSEEINHNDTIASPKDGSDYRYVRHYFEETTKNFSGNTFSASYSRLSQSLNVEIHAAKHDECFQFLGWRGPTSWVGVRLHLVLEKDACDEPAPIPVSDRVQSYVDGYQMRISGIQCQVNQVKKKRARIVTQYAEKILKKIAEKKGVESANEVSKKIHLIEFQRITKKFQNKISIVGRDFKKLMIDFSRKGAENTVTFRNNLVNLANASANAALSRIPEFMASLTDLSQRESAESIGYVIQARRMFGELEGLQVEYELELDLHRRFLKDTGLSPVRFADEEMTLLQKLIAACEARNQSFTESVRQVISMLQRREAALILSLSESAVRKTVSLSLRLEASRKFLTSLKTQIASIWAAPEVNQTLNQPYYEKSFLAKKQFLENQNLCRGADSANDWRKQGCLAIEPDLKRAEVYLRRTFLRQLKADAERWSFPDVLSLLDRGEILTAARSFDSAIRYLSKEKERVLK